MSNASRTTRTASTITVDSVYKADFQKAGSLTAQLRQDVLTISFYPSKKVDNEYNDSLFDAADFGYNEQQFPNTEHRVAWILVPDTMTLEALAPKIAEANANDACIYRVLSSAPIISSDQQWSIDNNDRTYDEYANSQVMRYGEGDKNEGQLIINYGKVQYRKTFFSKGPKADIDMRSTVDEYRSPEVIAELNPEKAPF